MKTQPKKMMAWAWTRGGAEKVERPAASWVEKPATMTRVMRIAQIRKKRSSRGRADAGARARVAICRSPPDPQRTYPTVKRIQGGIASRRGDGRGRGGGSFM